MFDWFCVRLAVGAGTRLHDTLLDALDEACRHHGEHQGVQWLAAARDAPSP